MPSLDGIDDPPAEVQVAIDRLRGRLDAELPPRTPATLLIGTRNIRAFGGPTNAWSTGPNDSPRRNLADVCALAEVVARFDVCAIQETRGDLTALRTMMRRLNAPNRQPTVALEGHTGQVTRSRSPPAPGTTGRCACGTPPSATDRRA